MFCLGVSCLLVGIIVILEMLCFIDWGEDCDVISVCLEMDELIVVGFFIVVWDMEEVDDGRFKYCVCWSGFFMGSFIMWIL